MFRFVVLSIIFVISIQSRVALSFGNSSGILSVAGDKACMLSEDGGLRCWGNSPRDMPTGLSNVSAISVNHSLACAISGGKATCFGQGSILSSLRDRPLSAIVTNDEASTAFVCGISEGQVFCDGWIHGQQSLPESAGPAVQLDAGLRHVCTLTDLGKVLCFGENYRGSTDVPANLGRAEQVVTGDRFTCFLVAGAVTCSGSEAPQVPPDLAPVSDLSASGASVCAITSSGPHCWGGGMEGASAAFFAPLPRVIALATGLGSTCALALDGVHCFGNAAVADVPRTSPYEAFGDFGSSVCSFGSGHLNCAGRIRVTESDVSKLSVGSDTACYLKNDIVSCIENAIVVPHLEITNATQLSSGGAHSCALTSRGVECWGRNNYGQSTPPADLQRVTEISAGENYSCAVTAGKVRCWGGPEDHAALDTPFIATLPAKVIAAPGGYCIMNRDTTTCDTYNFPIPSEINGLLDLTFSPQDACGLFRDHVECWSRPGFEMDVPHLTNPYQISMGGLGVCAWDAHGVHCWARPNADFFIPSDVTAPSAIAIGASHVCAIDRGEVVCWGENSYGKAIAPTGLTNPRQVVVGNYHSCALSDEGVTCWGEPRSMPPTDLQQVSSLIVADGATCAISAGLLRCWGARTFDVRLPAGTELTELSSVSSNLCILGEGGFQCERGGSAPKVTKIIGSNFHELKSSGENSCAKLGTDLYCWGTLLRANPERVKIKNVSTYAIGAGHVCALANGQLQCFGDSNGWSTDMLAITDVEQLFAGNGYTCISGHEMFSCYGRSRPLVSILWRLPAANVLAGLESSLLSISRGLYQEKKAFVVGLRNILLSDTTNFGVNVATSLTGLSFLESLAVDNPDLQLPLRLADLREYLDANGRFARLASIPWSSSIARRLLRILHLAVTSPKPQLTQVGKQQAEVLQAKIGALVLETELTTAMLRAFAAEMAIQDVLLRDLNQPRLKPFLDVFTQIRFWIAAAV